jgi:hypothetical protein
MQPARARCLYNKVRYRGGFCVLCDVKGVGLEKRNFEDFEYRAIYFNIPQTELVATLVAYYFN